MDWRIAVKRPSSVSHGLRVFNYPIFNYPIFNYPITRLPNYPIHRSSSGFTIIEILVVLALISILTTIAMAQYKNSVTYAREAVLKTDLFQLRDAIDQYYADKGQWPGTLDALVTDGYLRKIPVDPMTSSETSWQTIFSDPDPNNPTALPGVKDVKSGSDLTALDGTKYAEW
jgi:general secretion pathway protein G